MVRFRVGALAVLALAAGLVAWLVLRDTGSSDSEARPSAAKAISETGIANLAARVNHPVFWLGPRAGYSYELTENKNGSIFIRYLPAGTEIGSSTPNLTVATYPFPDAYGALQKVASRAGTKPIAIANDGVAVPSKEHPESVHVAYSGVDYQVEVFDPTPGNARRMVADGQLVAVGGVRPEPAPEANAASVADLRSLATTLGHPIYWVGPRKGYTYELQQSNGTVYLRYLPPRVKVGAKGLYLTVATYPYEAALTALQALAKENDKLRPVNLPGGGFALIDPDHPRSIHLAYPQSKVQIELFDSSPARVQQLVKSGKVAAIG